MFNVLIVDDSSLIRSILRDFLESSGKFKVVGEAENGREGVEKAIALNLDLVTMDIEMPLMNGLDAVREIRKPLAVPVVVISSHDTVKTAYEAMARGAVENFTPKICLPPPCRRKRGRGFWIPCPCFGHQGETPDYAGR
jgi:two-component system chemotaxis response regulator CheB